LYTTTYPCSWCAKSIVNAGVTRVVYLDDYPDPLAKDILSIISVVHYVPRR
jgi:dCMP deaminase